MENTNFPIIVRNSDLLFYGKNAIVDDIDSYPNGIVLVIDKPYKWTSADVVRKIKFCAQKYFHKKNIKVGHAGTLDPLATGILLVCLGKATKFAEKLQAERKEYIATIRVGATTPSFDLEKEIDAEFPYEHITQDRVKEVLLGMIGTQEQLPPIFSAKFIDGKRAYEMARAGKDVEMKPATITIYNLELLDFDLPYLKVRVECSKGTYIRSFARDLGTALNSGGHLTELKRTMSGQFLIKDALSSNEAISLFALEKSVQ